MVDRRARNRISAVDRALGGLGLLMVGLTGWAAERLEGRGRAARMLARLTLAVVAAIGRAFDRWTIVAPLVNGTRAGRAG